MSHVGHFALSHMLSTQEQGLLSAFPLSFKVEVLVLGAVKFYQVYISLLFGLLTC
jgi:hypothetical protein